MEGAGLLLLSVVLRLAYCQIDPICTAVRPNDGDPLLPQLPSQFYLSMEATLVERNVSVSAVEYFDGPGNRGRMDFTWRGRKINTVVDYNLKEAFVYPNPFSGDDCTVSLIGNRRNFEVRFIFGIAPGDNNTIHIGSPSLFFGLVNVTNFTYFGIESSNITRGIPCHHWKTCSNSFNSSFTLDYYFTNNTLWKTTYPDSDSLVPVLVKLSGSLVNMSTGELYSTEHYYSFFDFRNGPSSVPDEVFNIPVDLVCKGRLLGQPLPDFPEAFSSDIEIVSPNGITVVREYYDVTHQLVRIEGYNKSSFAFIQDFNVGSQYLITPDFQTCTVYAITQANSFFDSVVGGDGQLHLKSPRDLFLANSMFNFTYEGMTMVRGIKADVWISPREFEAFFNANVSNGVYIIYISRPGQRIVSEFGITTDPVVVQAQFKGLVSYIANSTVMERNISSTFSIFGFTRSEPPLDVYDTTMCLLRSDYTALRFRIPIRNISSLRSNIRTALIDYANRINMPFLSPLQINNIQIDTTSDSTAVLVSLQIANLSRNATVTWKYSAQSFVDKLTMGLENNSALPFTIKFTGFSSGTVTPMYYYIANTPTPGVGNAAIVGISVASVVFGVIVGIVVTGLVFLCIQNKGKSIPVSVSHRTQDVGQYKRQVDDELSLGNVYNDTDNK